MKNLSKTIFIIAIFFSFYSTNGQESLVNNTTDFSLYAIKSNDNNKILQTPFEHIENPPKINRKSCFNFDVETNRFEVGLFYRHALSDNTVYFTTLCNVTQDNSKKINTRLSLNLGTRIASPRPLRFDTALELSYRPTATPLKIVGRFGVGIIAPISRENNFSGVKTSPYLYLNTGIEYRITDHLMPFANVDFIRENLIFEESKSINQGIGFSLGLRYAIY